MTPTSYLSRPKTPFRGFLPNVELACSLGQVLVYWPITSYPSSVGEPPFLSPFLQSFHRKNCQVLLHFTKGITCSGKKIHNQYEWTGRNPLQSSVDISLLFGLPCQPVLLPPLNYATMNAFSLLEDSRKFILTWLPHCLDHSEAGLSHLVMFFLLVLLTVKRFFILYPAWHFSQRE